MQKQNRYKGLLAAIINREAYVMNKLNLNIMLK